ncbi:MAG: hypothetical protein RXO24_04680 [Acidilobus sp.]
MGSSWALPSDTSPQPLAGGRKLGHMMALPGAQLGTPQPPAQGA